MFSKENNAPSREEKLRHERLRKVKALLEKNRDIMNMVKNVLSGDKLSKIPNLVLQATKLLGDVETGSIDMGTKHNSLLGRLFTKKKEKKIEEVKPKNEVMIERDRLVTCHAEELTFDDEGNKNVSLRRRMFRVLSVHKKFYNKWYMASEKQECSMIMKEKDLKKHRCAVRMIIDGTVNDYDEMDLVPTNFHPKTVCKIITGVDILCVHNKMFTY